jgi:DNA (cytosine-5)-methyltransferase 1
LRSDGLTAQVVTGGFPCQDISLAGKHAGIEGERSGLWTELRRIIGEVGPRYAVLENVSALLARGMGTVVAELAEIGYRCEWHCIPASAVGAPHQRDRIWIIAYRDDQRPQGPGRGQLPPAQGPGQSREDLADAQSQPIGPGLRTDEQAAIGRRRSGDSDSPVPNTFGKRLEGLIQAGPAAWPTDRPGDGRDPSQWAVEPNVGRVVDGLPNRVDRLKCLGNAVVPQIPEMIGHALMAHAGEA